MSTETLFRSYFIVGEFSRAWTGWDGTTSSTAGGFIGSAASSNAWEFSVHFSDDDLFDHGLAGYQ
jgi:hypothetical protein